MSGWALAGAAVFVALIGGAEALVFAWLVTRNTGASAEVARAVDATTEAVNEQSHDLYGVLSDISTTLDTIRDQEADCA